MRLSKSERRAFIIAALLSLAASLSLITGCNAPTIIEPSVKPDTAIKRDTTPRDSAVICRTFIPLGGGLVMCQP